MENLLNYHTEFRPWGAFERFTLNEASTVKTITVAPEQAFSLQRHAHRKEFWKILAGSGVVIVGETSHEAVPGGVFFIETGVLHRASAGSDGLTILEISFGDFEENDIERVKDDYGRA